MATIGADGMKFGVSDCSITPVRNAEFHTTGPVAAEFTRYESGVDFCVWGVYMIVCIVGGWPWSCRTETETVSRMEKAGPFNYCWSHQSVASPSLCLSQGSRWTFYDGFAKKRNTLSCSSITTINAKNFHGSLTTVVRAQNDTRKTANITCTIFDRTLV